MKARGKPLIIWKHAFAGMNAERPPIQEWSVELVLEEPDHDDGRQAVKGIGRRTIIVYYEESEEEIHVQSVSATRRRLAP